MGVDLAASPHTDGALARALANDTVSPCCLPTIALVRALRAPRSCPVCSTTFELDDDAPRVAPALACDRRVHVDRDPTPERTGRFARPTTIDDAELVLVRGLLCELRPDRDGPFGWAPDGMPPKSEATPTLSGLPSGVIAPGPSLGRERVQCSATVPTIPAGAFRVLAQETAGTRAAQRVARLRDTDPVAAETLAWLQREGTLAKGLSALYRWGGEKFVDEATLERWEAAPASRREGSRVFGRRRILAAEKLWRAEAAPSSVPGDLTPACALR